MADCILPSRVMDEELTNGRYHEENGDLHVLRSSLNNIGNFWYFSQDTSDAKMKNSMGQEDEGGSADSTFVS